MVNEENANRIKALIDELHICIAEEEGWEPKTSRDYMILTWSKLERLEGIPDRVTRLETNQGILAGLQTALVIIGSTIAGYLGTRK